ncbi:MAG: hypothetical protein AB1483_12075 [Candidatus Zixiibacteriota bacterium]
MRPFDVTIARFDHPEPVAAYGSFRVTAMNNEVSVVAYEGSNIKKEHFR